MTACHERPEAVYPVVAPDGSSMIHISCGERPGRCYQIAGQICRNGYDLFSTVANSQTDVLARCHVPPPVTAAPPILAENAPSTATSGAQSGIPPLRGKGAGDSWVDAGEPANPWPTGSATDDLPWPPRTDESLAQPWPEAYRYRK